MNLWDKCFSSLWDSKMRNFYWVLPASETHQRSIIVLCVLLLLYVPYFQWRGAGGLGHVRHQAAIMPSMIFRQLLLDGHKHPPRGNLAEGKCVASSVSQLSLTQSPWSCFPVKSWSMISKWSLQFCLLPSKRKWILSSGETPNTSVLWKLSCTWRNKLIFWKTNKQTN